MVKNNFILLADFSPQISPHRFLTINFSPLISPHNCNFRKIMKSLGGDKSFGGEKSLCGEKSMGRNQWGETFRLVPVEVFVLLAL